MAAGIQVYESTLKQSRKFAKNNVIASEIFMSLAFHMKSYTQSKVIRYIRTKLMQRRGMKLANKGKLPLSL